MTRGHRIALVGLAAVAVAACGTGDDNQAASSSLVTTVGAPTSTLSNGAPPGTVAPAPPADAAAGGNDDDGIDSVQWGPDDPPIPGEYLAFAVDRADGLACGSIDDRAQGDPFWTLAADVCRVFRGEGNWPDVSAVPPPPSDANPYQRCLDGELFDMLGRALTWHNEHPGESPVVRYPARGTHSPCQTSLYDVGPTGADEQTDEGCDNDPSLVVPTPGVPVVIGAPGIIGYANPEATVNGGLLCVIRDSQDNALRTFVVVVPTSGEEQVVTIDVTTDYGTLRADVALPAVAVGTTTSSVATTDAESPIESPTTTTAATTTTDATGAAPRTTDNP